MKRRYLRGQFLIPCFIVMILFLTSCTSRPEPYSVLEFTGGGDVINYSKSKIMVSLRPDSLSPASVLGSTGDLFTFTESTSGNEGVFIYNDTSSQNRFLFEYDEWTLNVNGKVSNIYIPGDNKMIPWFENMKGKDFSALQFVSIGSKLPEVYLPYLARLAEIKPDAGLIGIDSLGNMKELLKIFKPRYIAGGSLHYSDNDMLSGLTNLEILVVSLDDSAEYYPLPPMPELKQLFLTEINEDAVLTNNFLINNRQIEKVIVQNYGAFDFLILEPLKNLKELVVSGCDSVVNPTLINNYKKLEVLSVTGDNLVYNPDMIKLPSLRWMAFSSKVTQDEFNSFVETHPKLEVIDLIDNEKISSLGSLSKLTRLYGLTVTDTITDVTSVKTLSNLKFLSLPSDFLDDPANKAEIQKSLPDTRVVANEGFCLGSGWLLLLIPLVLLFRFFASRERQTH